MIGTRLADPLLLALSLSCLWVAIAAWVAAAICCSSFRAFFEAFKLVDVLKRIPGYQFCEDCAYYFECGRLDDTTVMEVEES